MQLIEKDNNLNKTGEDSQETLHECEGCHDKVKYLYQNNLCRNCLNKSFKRLVKVIDSVRN